MTQLIEELAASAATFLAWCLQDGRKFSHLEGSCTTDARLGFMTNRVINRGGGHV